MTIGPYLLQRMIWRRPDFFGKESIIAIAIIATRASVIDTMIIYFERSHQSDTYCRNNLSIHLIRITSYGESRYHRRAKLKHCSKKADKYHQALFYLWRSYDGSAKRHGFRLKAISFHQSIISIKLTDALQWFYGQRCHLNQEIVGEHDFEFTRLHSPRKLRTHTISFMSCAINIFASAIQPYTDYFSWHICGGGDTSVYDALALIGLLFIRRDILKLTSWRL